MKSKSINKPKKHILFVAAENDGIIGCKAGGIGDVVRDAAQALGQKGYQVSVITPAYGRLHLPADKLTDVEFVFKSQVQKGELYEIEGKDLFKQISEQYERFIFLNGYSEKAANALYEGGSLFIMPSSFEPCGISQLLSMRAGQPCLVHSIGGLKDTVQHGKTGFQFDGQTMAEKGENMLEVFKEAVNLYLQKPKAWDKISTTAAKERFLWEDAIEQYIKKLYQI